MMSISSHGDKDVKHNDLESGPAYMLEAMVSKICHDLIAPVGAIANGLELLKDQLVSVDEVLPVVQESVDSASQKLSLFRAALGRGATHHFQEFEDMVKFLSHMCAPRSISIKNQVTLKNQKTPFYGRLFLNLCHIISEAMPRGGELALIGDLPLGAGEQILLQATGHLIPFKDVAKDILTQDGVLFPEAFCLEKGSGRLEISPQTIQILLTRFYMEQEGIKASVKEGPSQWIHLTLQKA